MKRSSTIQCPVIVGRDDLLALLDRLVGETAQGHGHALFLSGQAGLGKTRLIRSTIRKAEGAGVRVDGGSVAPQDHQVPLASIRDFAAGLRGDDSFGSLPGDLLAIDGRHDGDALGARRLIVRATADRILAECDPTWRTIVALARYAGLSTPSEPLALTWCDVAWAKNRE